MNVNMHAGDVKNRKPTGLRTDYARIRYKLRTDYVQYVQKLRKNYVKKSGFLRYFFGHLGFNLFSQNSPKKWRWTPCFGGPN